MNREFFKCDVNIFCLYTAFLDRYVHIIVMKCSLKQCLIIAQYLKLIRSNKSGAQNHNQKETHVRAQHINTTRSDPIELNRIGSDCI